MLAPAFFLPKNSFFDQFLQTVKNKSTVLIIVFKEFLQTSIPPLISLLYAKGYRYVPLKNFRLTVLKNFVWEHFGVSEIFGERKTLCIREGVSSFFIENILSHSTRKFRRGALRCIRNFRRAKNFMHQSGGNKFLHWKHFVTQYQKFSSGSTSVYQKFSESEKLYASERGYQVSSLKTFCHTVPENFAGEHFGVSEIFGERKTLCIREGGITFLRWKHFVTQYQKNSSGSTSVYQKFSESEKLYASERG